MLCVFIRVLRQVEIGDQMWDLVWSVFRVGVWSQMIEQWSKFVEVLTKALILNLFDIETGSPTLNDNQPAANNLEVI
jgi:hypothetical protein